MQKGAILIILLQKMKNFAEKKFENRTAENSGKISCVKIIKHEERLIFGNPKKTLLDRKIK